MEKYSFDRDWLFHLGDVDKPEFPSHTYCYMASKAGGATGAASPDYDFSGWEKINLPHDWAVSGEFDERWGPASGYKPRGKGWYCKRFRLDEQDRGKQLLLEFGGVSTHAIVYCNGSVVVRNFCGYTSFTADITDMAVYGDEINTVCVFVDAEQIEGWWYEGAGIYRHVWLYKKEPVHAAHWGVFVSPARKTVDVWDTHVETTVENSAYTDTDFMVRTVVKNENGITWGHSETKGTVKAGSQTTIHTNIMVYSPILWDVDEPYLYVVETEIYVGDIKTDNVQTRFGYRTIEITPDDGFYLNGRRVQIYGACNHQDHAGVGVAVPDAINEYRIRLLKEMGTNAYRCSHGNPTPEILDYCDRYGLLVMDENRNFNTSPDGLAQVRSMVRRDRNHPCVVMYSLFNEEPLQGTPVGRKLAQRMACEIKKLDDTRLLVGAMNTGLLDDDGCADLLDMTGFNYNTYNFDAFREKYPQMPMIGTENNSAFQTRGVYRTDDEKHEIDSYDSIAAPWGNTHRDGFRQIDTRPHIAGMFIWTGFDYRGEPTPYEWGSIGTQFGIMDTCGFKKDAFYQNRAYFTDEPLIHMLPHWNWQEGQKVRVMACTNCDEAELFINEATQGRKKVDRYDTAEWKVTFVSGVARMVGYRAGKIVCQDVRRTAGEPFKLVLESTRDFVYADCLDAVAVNVYAEDNNGICVPDASNHIKFAVSGGLILGVGNGDPNSHEADRASERDLFHGCAQVIVQVADGASTLSVSASADGLAPCTVDIEVKQRGQEIRYIPSVSEMYVNVWREKAELSQERPDPMMKIEDSDMNTWEIVRPGSEDKKFDVAGGYALYRAVCDVPEGRYVLHFHELMGNAAEIYLDGEKVFEEACKDGCSAEIALPKAGKTEIAVVIYNDAKGKRGGLTKSVSLVEKQEI